MGGGTPGFLYGSINGWVYVLVEAFAPLRKQDAIVSLASDMVFAPRNIIYAGRSVA